ncbi:MAG: NAD(P)-dependent oxidoreductase [Phycisphaeraceae bacterium]|nr:NAD(P)-dependent oxidoreductase [Phycisphaeraceae bacterium]
MKVLTTGGSGFIGRYFVESMLAQGDEVVILDLVRPEWDIGRAEFVAGDIRDPAAVRAAMGGCDAVLHLAAAHHDFGIEEGTYYSVNEDGARVICDEADAAGVKNICFYSTVAVFGDAPEPHHEDSPKHPVSPYGGSKLAGEAVFAEWAAKGGSRRCLVIRPTVTFGPRNFANMYSLIRQIHSGRFLDVGDGTNVKSLSYVENIVDATLWVWRREAASAFEIYNYIDKPDLSAAQISATISRALGRKPSKLRVPLGLACLLALPFDVVIKLTGKNLPVSSARIRKLCTQTKFEADKIMRAGYKAKVPLSEGIEQMVKWYLAEGQRQQAVWHVPPAQVRRAGAGEPPARQAVAATGEA